MRRLTLLATTAAVLLPSLAFGGFRVSSHKDARRGEGPFDAKSAIDGDEKTCWQTDPEAQAKGSWIEIDVPQGKVDKIAAVVGWNKDAEHWTDYARIQNARVEVITETDSGEKVVLEKDITFEDKKGMQIIDLEDTAVGGELFGGKVKLTVTGLYEGEDYPNLAVSEVLVHMAEQDVSGGQFKAASSETDDHLGIDALDDNTRTYWLTKDSAKGVTFSFEAPGFGVSKVAFQQVSTNYARPKTLKIRAAGQEIVHELEDSTRPQFVLVPAVTGYTGSAWGEITVEVVDIYPGRKSEQMAIAEIMMKATTFDSLF